MMLERSQGSGESSEKAYGCTGVVILGCQRSNDLLLFSDARFCFRNLAVSLRKLGTSIQHAESTQTDRKRGHPKIQKGPQRVKRGQYRIFGRDCADHSALMPANFTTLAHFSVSLARRRPKLAGGPGGIVPPMSASRAFALGSARIALISMLSRPMISGGVFLGAMMPKNALAS